MAKAPIIPVAVEGSYDVFEKNKRLSKAPVKLTFLEPINTMELSREDQKSNLSDKIYSAIKEKIGSAESEAPADTNEGA
jgi:1-acyl-sn-glycerol-3-phosphate acyltransferase